MEWVRAWGPALSALGGAGSPGEVQQDQLWDGGGVPPGHQGWDGPAGGQPHTLQLPPTPRA